jgi:CRISPR-associated protein Cmr3
MSDTWRSFRLVPDDVLFFRDGRPATRGDDHYLPSIFPPHPSTLYGAIRTRRLLDAGVDLSRLGPHRSSAWKELPADLRAELGEWGGFGSLEIRGPWLVRDETDVLLPAPADLGVTFAPRPKPKRHEEPVPPEVKEVARFLRSESGLAAAGGHSRPLALLHPFSWDADHWKPWEREDVPPRSAREWFLRPEGFRRWAEGRAPEPGDFVHPLDLWAAEPRVGVAIDEDQRSSREGHLFTFGFIRLKKRVALGFEARGTGLAPECRVRLGGDAKTAWLTDGPSFPSVSAGAGERLRLAFATPALFEEGAWPPGFSAERLDGSVAGHAARLRGGCLPGYVQVGGWDLAKGAAKALRRALPAGAVYLIEKAGAESFDPAALHGSHVAGYPGEHLARQGFGLILAGLEPASTS